MTVSEYIFDFLQKQGLTKVYMVSGSSAMWLTDALYRNPQLKVVCCHHEQAAAMSADGYGRVHGVPGACLVTVGPGATNAITGVAQAYLDSSAMFVISGQANSGLLKKEIETKIRQTGTQSLNLEPIVSSITKYFHAVMEPDEIVKIMQDAYHSATSGRKGPVWIDVPVDIQNKQISEDAISKAESRNPWAGNSSESKTTTAFQTPDYQSIVDCIRKAHKPLILAGAGVTAGKLGKALLAKAANELSVPIVTSRGGIDAVESDFKWYVGRPGAYGDRPSHFALAQCDYLMILGSRLSVSTIGYYPGRFADNAYKIMVDIDALELERDDVLIGDKYCIDVEQFLQNLLEVSGKTKSYPDSDFLHEKWNSYLQNLKIRYPVVLKEYVEEKPLSEYYVTSRIAHFTGRNTNIVVDTGSVCNIVSQSWHIKKGQKYLISGGLSCMGFWATSIGAYQEGLDLIAIAGDGSAQMNIQELATLRTNKIPLKLFIYQNSGYMLIRHNQHNYMNDRYLGVGPDSGVETPDYTKVADAYGVKSYQIETEADLERVIPQVLAATEPVVCQILVQQFAPIVPRIASKVMPDGSFKAADFDDLYPFLTEKEYQSALYTEEDQ